MRIPIRLLAASLVAVALASCVPRVAPPPVAARPPRPSPAPPPAPLAADWRDWPQTPGDWRYARYNGRSSATFGSGADDTGALTLSCTAERTIRITRAGQQAGPMTIRTTSLTRVLPTTLVGDPPAGSLATLAATDPLLDAMGFSRGRFVVEQAGAPPLVVPAWAEIERVTQDCRG